MRIQSLIHVCLGLSPLSAQSSIPAIMDVAPSRIALKNQHPVCRVNEDRPNSSLRCVVILVCVVIDSCDHDITSDVASLCSRRPIFSRSHRIFHIQRNSPRATPPVRLAATNLTTTTTSTTTTTTRWLHVPLDFSLWLPFRDQHWWQLRSDAAGLETADRRIVVPSARGSFR